MIVFKAGSTGEMAKEVYTYLKQHGVERNSRNGKVLMLPDPVTMVYLNPWMRCNFTKGRDANPVFHHMESLWMLAGRDDVEFLTMFNSNMVNYSDDGKTFNAPYGYRIRRHFDEDQLHIVASILHDDPDSRQAVIQIWDQKDLIKITRDKACNMLMVFSIGIYGEVNLIVFNRSNDAVYGAVTGANPVHFSYFLQWVSEQLNRAMGRLTFVSNNLHVYTELYDHWDKMDWTEVCDYSTQLYDIGELREIEQFCDMVVDKKIIKHTFESPMLENLSKHMANLWIARKYGDDPFVVAEHLDKIAAIDWKMAINQWLMARKK